MPTFSSPCRPSRFLCFLAIVLPLAACSPKHEWREVRGSNAPFSILMPAKHASMVRDVNLGGVIVPMTMSAAEVEGVTFAIGHAVMADPAAAQAALAAMKTAMINNIGGAVRDAAPSAAAPSANPAPQQAGGDIEAKGTVRGQPWLMKARFVARGQRVYQAVVMGPEKSFSREAADTFLESFKPN